MLRCNSTVAAGKHIREKEAAFALLEYKKVSKSSEQVDKVKGWRNVFVHKTFESRFEVEVVRELLESNL